MPTINITKALLSFQFRTSTLFQLSHWNSTASSCSPWAHFHSLTFRERCAVAHAVALCIVCLSTHSDKRGRKKEKKNSRNFFLNERDLIVCREKRKERCSDAFLKKISYWVLIQFICENARIQFEELNRNIQKKIVCL